MHYFHVKTLVLTGKKCVCKFVHWGPPGYLKKGIVQRKKVYPYLLFWNQIMICLSESFRDSASSFLSSLLKNDCCTNLASNEASCFRLKMVLLMGCFVSSLPRWAFPSICFCGGVFNVLSASVKHSSNSVGDSCGRHRSTTINTIINVLLSLCIN